MNWLAPVVIHGTFTNGAFVATEPLPDAEGPAELIVHVQQPSELRPSVYDAYGKAKEPRTAQELDAQLAEERAAWGDR
jgi:hypothetical protein